MGMSMSQETTSWQPELGFGDRLRLVRREYSRLTESVVTQEAMASLLGVNPSTYRLWEAGINEPRDLVGIARRLAEVTGADPAWILGLVKIGNRCLAGLTGGEDQESQNCNDYDNEIPHAA